MNESTEQILIEICQKLGVGVEMIWSAYVKQAPIGAIELFDYVFRDRNFAFGGTFDFVKSHYTLL